MRIDQYLKDRSSHRRDCGPGGAVIGAFENSFNRTHHRRCIRDTFVVRIKSNRAVLERVGRPGGASIGGLELPWIGIHQQMRGLKGIDDESGARNLNLRCIARKSVVDGGPGGARVGGLEQARPIFHGRI